MTMTVALFSNSNWFVFDEDKALNDRSISSEASPSPNSELSSPNVDDETDEVILGEDDDERKGSASFVQESDSDDVREENILANGANDKSEDDIRSLAVDVNESRRCK